MKLDNILLFNMFIHDKSRIRLAKLTDFGLSHPVYSRKDSHIKPGNFAGTRGYMAPEIVRLDAYEDFADNNPLEFDPFKADIYALGVCLFEMLTKNIPYADHGNDMVKVYEAQLSKQWDDVELSTKVSPECHQILDEMLEPEPNQRIDPIGIYLHPWIQNQDINVPKDKPAKPMNFLKRMYKKLV